MYTLTILPLNHRTHAWKDSEERGEADGRQMYMWTTHREEHRLLVRHRFSFERISCALNSDRIQAATPSDSLGGGGLSIFHGRSNCTTTLPNAALALAMPGKGKDESPGSCIARLWNQTSPDCRG